MTPEGVDSLRGHCDQQDVAFFSTHWGGGGADGKKRAKKENGRKLNGRTFDEMPANAIHCCI